MTINIKIEGKPLKYDFSFEDTTTNELSKAVSYLEIIKKRLIDEIEEREKKHEMEES